MSVRMQDIHDSGVGIAAEIFRGRLRAHEKHGAQGIESIPASDPRWLSILVEEVGEASHELTYDATGSLRAELIDIATVAVAWVAALDRESGGSCTGAGDCRADIHYHGCFADHGNCDDPTDHEPEAQKHEH